MTSKDNTHSSTVTERRARKQELLEEYLDATGAHRDCGVRWESLIAEEILKVVDYVDGEDRSHQAHANCVRNHPDAQRAYADAAQRLLEAKARYDASFAYFD